MRRKKNTGVNKTNIGCAEFVVIAIIALVIFLITIAVLVIGGGQRFIWN